MRLGTNNDCWAKPSGVQAGVERDMLMRRSEECILTGRLEHHEVTLGEAVCVMKASHAPVSYHA